jgi:hypothetical protein
LGRFLSVEYAYDRKSLAQGPESVLPSRDRQGVAMGLRPTKGYEKPARGEAIANIEPTEGGFFRGAVA